MSCVRGLPGMPCGLRLRPPGLRIHGDGAAAAGRECPIPPRRRSGATASDRGRRPQVRRLGQPDACRSPPGEVRRRSRRRLGDPARIEHGPCRRQGRGRPLPRRGRPGSDPDHRGGHGAAGDAGGRHPHPIPRQPLRGRRLQRPRHRPAQPPAPLHGRGRLTRRRRQQRDRGRAGHGRGGRRQTAGRPPDASRPLLRDRAVRGHRAVRGAAGRGAGPRLRHRQKCHRVSCRDHRRAAPPTAHRDQIARRGHRGLSGPCARPGPCGLCVRRRRRSLRNAPAAVPWGVAAEQRGPARRRIPLPGQRPGSPNWRHGAALRDGRGASRCERGSPGGEQPEAWGPIRP